MRDEKRLKPTVLEEFSAPLFANGERSDKMLSNRFLASAAVSRAFAKLTASTTAFGMFRKQVGFLALPSTRVFSLSLSLLVSLCVCLPRFFSYLPRR